MYMTEQKKGTTSQKILIRRCFNQSIIYSAAKNEIANYLKSQIKALLLSLDHVYYYLRTFIIYFILTQPVACILK